MFLIRSWRGVRFEVVSVHPVLPTFRPRQLGEDPERV
jgi:hypothetical protein